ncbi:HIT family protein [Kribbella karoonensis]|uniref:HIT family protein n=2 Tax=Kribbellaceae TaxID=2726069 RepID=A0ABN2DD86_9ACTN
MHCTFCTILAGKLPSRILYEDEHAAAFLDLNPLRRGHTLVVPRLHINDLTDEQAPTAITAVAKALHATTRLLIEKLPSDGVSLLQANGVAAGQDVFHLHFHLVPRRTRERQLTDHTPDEAARQSLDATYEVLRGTRGYQG